MARFLRWSLVRRFATVARQQGLGSALSKSLYYSKILLRGSIPSVFQEAQPPRHAPEQTLQVIWSEMARGDGFHVTRRTEDRPRIALIGDLNLAQCRKYRVEQLAAFWNGQGVACDFAHYEDIPRAIKLLQQATHLCEYRLEASPLTAMYRYEARRLGMPVLFDIDDPLFSVSAYETYHNMTALDPALKAHFLAVAPRYAAMMNGADMVTVSTPGLAAHARLYTRRPVHVRRNFADADTLTAGAAAMAARAAAQLSRDGLFRVVFASGSQGHEADFDLIRDEIAGFVTADPARRLTILGHFRTETLPEALRAQTEHHSFLPYADYLALLAGADVAVMPLQDDTFNRCKSGVRVIDAASVGLVPLVSAVGDLSALVEDGQTGFIARTSGDWARALELLAANPARLQSMSRAARARLETHWSAQAAAHIVDPEILDWIRT